MKTAVGHILIALAMISPWFNDVRAGDLGIPEYVTSPLYCVAQWGEDSPLFGGQGIGWAAKHQALEGCRYWAERNRLDPDQCQIKHCDFLPEESYRWEWGVSPRSSGSPLRTCMEQALTTHDHQIVLARQRRYEAYQLCFAHPVGDEFDACVYELLLDYEAELGAIETDFEAATKACLEP